MRKLFRWHSPFSIFGLLLFISLSGCLPISKELRTQADKTLTFQQVFKNPEAYKGKIVIWGGEVVETTDQKEGTTLIIVLQRSLHWTQEPEFGGSEGRFVILMEGYVDPDVFREGMRITVAGEIQGKQVMRLDELEYAYPLLLSKQIYLWREHYYSPYPYDWWSPSKYPIYW